MRGAVAPGGLELEHHMLGGVALHAFVGKRWARDVAAQLLECLAVLGAAAHCGVQAETLLVGTQRLRARSVSRPGAPQSATCAARRTRDKTPGACS